MRFALAALLLLQETKPDELPLVEPVSGTLQVWRGEKAETIEKAMRVAASDRLGTPGGNPARFSIESSLLVVLKGIAIAKDKGLAIERKVTKIVLKVFKGTVALESFGSEIELETPAGKVEAGKKVYFIATVDEQGTKIVVLEGKLTFTNDLGSVTVSEGQSSESGEKKAPTKPHTTVAGDGDWVRAAEEPSNLLKNPSFEQGFEDWPLDASFSAKIERQVVKSGEKSYRVDVKGPQSNPILPMKTAKGVLKKGSKYLVRCFVRSENFQRDGKAAKLKIGIDPSGKGSMTDTKLHFEFDGSEGAWVARRMTFEATGPDVAICAYLGTDPGAYTGTVWFDDFYLGEIPSRK